MHARVNGQMGVCVKWGRNVYQALAMITQFGINMLVPIFLCTFLGMWLDKVFMTSWLTILLFFIGALAGFRNVYMFAKRIYSIESDRTSYTGRHRKDNKLYRDGTDNRKTEKNK